MCCHTERNIYVSTMSCHLSDTLKETLIIRLTWRAFSKLREKHPDLLFDIDNGQFLFTDNSVTLHLRPEALNALTYTQIH